MTRPQRARVARREPLLTAQGSGVGAWRQDGEHESQATGTRVVSFRRTAKAFEEKIDFDHTLFIVSSKSGTTLEPNIFMRYFLQRTRERVGAAEAPHRFIAITDPDSQLHRVAEAEGFRRVFFGLPSIGGRYSALSNFGMVPLSCQSTPVNPTAFGPPKESARSSPA